MVRLFLLVFLLVPLTRAQLLEGEWVRSVEAKLVTRHLEHGVVRADESLQPGVRFSNGPLTLGACTNLPLAGDERQQRELTLTARYVREFGGALTLSGAVAHRAVRKVRDGHPGQVTEFSLLLARPLGSGRIETVYLRDTKRQADLGELAYAGEWPLRAWGAFLHYRLFVGTESARDVLPERPGPCVADAYFYHGLELSLPYRIGGSAVVTATAGYAGTRGQRPFWSPVGASAGGQIALSLAATYEF